MEAPPTIVTKVVAYAVRQRGGRAELLVFDHPDFPEAGTQVPAGTIEPGESPDAALEREVEEETGRGGFQRVRHLGTYDYAAAPSVIHRRHVYLVRPPADLPETWQWGEQIGTPDEIRFAFYWLPLSPVPLLSGGLDEMLGLLDTGNV